MKSCPIATKNLKVNTENRNKAIKAKHIQYGPLNLADEGYWDRLAKHWNTSTKVARKSLCGNCAAFDVSPRMEECMPGMVQKDGVLGYCHMHKFKCHSKRTCYTWAAGGPIKQDSVSRDWQGKKEESVMKLKEMLDVLSEGRRGGLRLRRPQPGDAPGEEERDEAAKEIEALLESAKESMLEVLEDLEEDISDALSKFEENGGSDSAVRKVEAMLDQGFGKAIDTVIAKINSELE